MDNQSVPDRRAKEINEVGKIAKHFGFQPIVHPPLEKQDFSITKIFDPSSLPAEKSALLRMYFEDKMISLPQPNMFYCERPFGGIKEVGTHRRSSSKVDCLLTTLGSAKSACECLSIQTAMTVLNFLGYKNLEVEVNSIGDKDSVVEFQRKLTIYVRKNFNAFPAELRQALKKDILAIFKEKGGGCENFETECPKPIDFLSEVSRLHFKEIIEFLEIMNISYRINHCLVGDLNFGSETVFSIKNDGEELAYGFRFNRLAKKIGHKKDLPCTALNIYANSKKHFRKMKIKAVNPQFYLIQFGPEAKLKSFLILQELYKAGVAVSHSIAKDKLGGQIGTAETSDIPYIILVGQKEALENSVVIRNTQTRAQEIVPINALAAKVKGLV